MAPKKVALKSIKSLTFYKDEETAARRTSPISQLRCIGKPCKVFQSEVVQCLNMGDDGAGGVQWKCETDLPKNIRLGKVRVSCEGWSAAGDKSVLQGSCGLEYNLHSVNRGLEYGEDPQIPRSNDQLLSSLFLLVFVFIGGVIIYSLIRSCLQRHAPRYTPPPFPWGGGGGDGPGFGGGGPPPPYTKQPENTGMGLGTAAGLGALGGAAAMGASQLLSPRPYRQEPRMREVDRSDERGEGSSNGMRRATGFGGSSSR